MNPCPVPRGMEHMHIIMAVVLVIIINRMLVSSKHSVKGEETTHGVGW